MTKLKSLCSRFSNLRTPRSIGHWMLLNLGKQNRLALCENLPNAKSSAYARCGISMPAFQRPVVLLLSCVIDYVSRAQLVKPACSKQLVCLEIHTRWNLSARVCTVRMPKIAQLHWRHWTQSGINNLLET